MKTTWKIIIAIIVLASICLADGNMPKHPDSPHAPVKDHQIKRAFADDKLASNLPASGKVFVGSIKSNKYHFQNCRAARLIKLKDQIWFSSSEEARNHGYKPCRICHPF